MRKIEQDILSILVREKTTEELMEELFAKYMINTMSVQEFFLLRTTVLAYLSSLCSRNVVRNGFKEGILSWKRM